MLATHKIETRTVARKFSIRGLCVSSWGYWVYACHSKSWKKLHWSIMLHVSIWGDLEFCLRRLSPPKPPRGDGTDWNTKWMTRYARSFGVPTPWLHLWWESYGMGQKQMPHGQARLSCSIPLGVQLPVARLLFACVRLTSSVCLCLKSFFNASGFTT